MKKVYTEDQKKLILDRYWAGEKVSTISSDTGIAKSTIYAWTKINFKYSQNYSLFISVSDFIIHYSFENPFFFNE